MIQLTDISKSYTKNNIVTDIILRINLTIEPRDFVGIMGSSGSGKTTLLNIIAGLVPIKNGTYLFEGKKLEINNRAKMELFRLDEVGIVFQNYSLIEDLTVYDNIALPLRYQKIKPNIIRERVCLVMEDLEIEKKSKCYPRELSGGEQQRVAIARAIIKNPKIIIADEPTGALDECSTEKVLKTLENVNNKGMTIIIATHDMNVAKRCNKLYKLKFGELTRYEEGA